MEKTIKIDGKPVTFKATGSLPVRYRMEFGTDVFADLAKISGVQEDYSKLDSMVFYQLLYIAAKTADSKIAPMMDWLDSFESFPVYAIYNEVADVFGDNMRMSEKN